MAADWIPMRVDLAEDPAVIAISSATGLDEFAVVGRLHRLWSWANTHTTNGHALGVTQKWLDAHLRAEGFASAMLRAGWLREKENGIVFPRFDRWNSQPGKARALATRRKRAERSREERDNGVTREQERRGDKQHPTNDEDSEPSKARRPRSSRARRVAVFVPPTVEEVEILCRERRNSINAAAFVAHYANQDWCLKNGRKMKDWKYAIVTWEANNFNRPAGGKPGLFDGCATFASMDDQNQGEA